MNIALTAGHHTTDGGNPKEIELTGPITKALAHHCRARGADTRVVTPNEGLDIYPGPLASRIARVARLDTPGWNLDVFLEIHAEWNSSGDAGRGCFVIYPDWNIVGGADVDVKVRDDIGPRITKEIAAKAKIPVRKTQNVTNGVMSEKDTNVGSKGSRLGVFNLTSHLRATCRRMIIEVGAYTSPKDLQILNRPDTADKIGRAIAEALIPTTAVPRDYQGEWGTIAPYFPNHGIPQEWRDEIHAGRHLGKAISQEFDYGGKVWQIFEKGAISWTPGGTEVKRPTPRRVELEYCEIVWGEVAPYIHAHGIPERWRKELFAGKSLGRALSSEFDFSGAIWQIFESGAISWVGGRTQVKRPTPPEVAKASAGG